MATISLTVPLGVPAKIADGLCAAFNYDLYKKPGETRGEFSERMTKHWWQSKVPEMVPTATYNPDDPFSTDL